ncbi:MAG TPA: APC family permease [Rectinemataceae bacterium]|nr:APC family permease [Rectinemataceae bacterium]
MNGLRKTITTWKGVTLAVSMIIGSGLLGLPGMALEVGNVHTAAGGWMLIALALIPLVYIFTRLGLKFTSSAGLSRYARESMGAWGGHAVAAVLCGTFTIGIPALALIGGAYAKDLLGLPENSIYWLALVILALAAAGNLLGAKVINIVNSASLIALTAMVLLIIVSNIPFLGAGLKVFGETMTRAGDLDYRDLWRVTAILFWAFIGWENLSFSLEEFKNPAKSIPRVFWLSFLVVLFLYFGIIVTSIGAEASGISVRGASGLTALVKQTPMGVFQAAIMALVIPANAIAWVLSASRLYYASGRDGILPSFLGRLAKDGTPLNSVLVSFVAYSLAIAVTYVFRINLSGLVLIVSQNFLVLYVISIFAYWKTEKSNRRWIVTALAALSCGFLLSGFNWWILYPLALLLVGYLGYRRTNARKKFNYDGGGLDGKQ